MITRNKTVLIVDDNQIIRDQLCKELNRHFFNTIVAENGKLALEILNGTPIHIILLDLKLPDYNGLDLLTDIKKKLPECEIIVITGYGGQDSVIQSLRRGAIDYIEKPIQLDELYAALGRAQEKLAEKEDIVYSLLVIDDDELQVDRLIKVLKKEGYDVLGAYNGAQGLEIIEKNKIDVVITDMSMDGLNGIDVLREAKKIYKDIEGIIITGYADLDMTIKSIRVGAIDYILKPINLDNLLYSVHKAIERIYLNRNRVYRHRELKITSEIMTKLNEELEIKIKHKAHAMKKIQTQLYQTSKLATLGEMAAGLAHEINQPLGAIALITTHYRKLIQLNRLSEEELESGLADIETSVKRMTNIIQHIRTFSNQGELKCISLEIHETLESALALLSEQLRIRQITVEKEFRPNIPLICGEPYQLEQVWINLITNARDSMDEKALRPAPGEKRLLIKTIYQDGSDFLEVHFADNGMGMSKETKEKIFEPFFTSKEVGKAMGLGLSISYGIIEKHNGIFEVESIEGEGTVMKVRLPLEKNNG